MCSSMILIQVSSCPQISCYAHHVGRHICSSDVSLLTKSIWQSSMAQPVSI